MDAAKVGKTISFLRKEAGLTQNELAKRLNITDKAVSRWERGCGTPDISLLTKLSSALNTDIKTILSSDSISIGSKCKGLLILKYPEGITASSFFYTQRIIYFQISYFILAGIRDICMFGKKEDIDFSKSQFGKGDSFGINIVYEFIDDNSDFTLYSSKYFAENNKDVSFLVINRLAFWYSKDTVNTLTRLIHDSDCCTEIVNSNRQPLSIRFYPPKNLRNSCIDEEKNIISYPLTSGEIAFLIQNTKDLFDAGNIIRIIEEQQGEKIADLQEIAQNRGFV